VGQHFNQESSVYEVVGLLIVREIHYGGMRRKRKSRRKGKTRRTEEKEMKRKRRKMNKKGKRRKRRERRRIKGRRKT
jgi:hypothetical protein